MHSRRMLLSADGMTLEGLDRLEPPSGRLRLKARLPFSVHFHLHPDCKCTRGGDAGVTITARDGQQYAFAADGAALIEESLYFVDSAGPGPRCRSCLGPRPSANRKCAGGLPPRYRLGGSE